MKAKRKDRTGSKTISNATDQSKNKEAPPSFLERSNRYSNLIVGTATVLLVVVTAVYIFLSWTIAKETKRLADISVEQFRIKSYPTFLITRTNPTYADGRYKDQIKIHNKGEISSYETSILILYAIRTQEQPLSFLANWTYVYRDKDTESIDVLDYSKKIPANSWASIGIDIPVPESIIKNLQYQIVIIKHRVPYDPSFTYETHAFAWEVTKQDDDSKQNTFHWETLPDSRRDVLREKLFNSEIIAPNREKKIIEFFTDYPNAQRLKFHKKKPPNQT